MDFDKIERSVIKSKKKDIHIQAARKIFKKKSIPIKEHKITKTIPTDIFYGVHLNG
jgi:hypothetical protein